MLVLDNSVAMRWCFKDGSEDDLIYAENVLDSLTSGNTFLVPNLWHLEVVNVLVRAEKRQWLDAGQVQEFLSLMQKLPLKVDAETAQKAMSETFALAREYNLSAYDAAYLELALRYKVPLATLDVDLRKAANKINVSVFGIVNNSLEKE
jgi:predicted nucleic acid-binding protein